MPFSWTTQHSKPTDKFGGAISSVKESLLTVQRPKRLWITLCAVIVCIAIALGIGLGIGLTQGGGSDSISPPAPVIPTNYTNTTTGDFWRPTAGTTWQIVLLSPPTDISLNVSVYDIDLFTTSTSMIAALHAQNRKVICYFSAGSYEANRTDSSQFKSSDKGKELSGWPGEFWLDTTSTNVRSIMSGRLDLAASKGCDGVDPDNVDGYDNNSGFNLTPSTAVDYLSFLTAKAHNLKLAIGLKNAGSIVNATLDMMQWEVNEQCEQYSECDVFRPFIAANKPVFHIEYPSSAPSISAKVKSKICNDASIKGFSTVMKEMDLDDWMEAC
ncbi:glycoside hydrolase superfamily [Tricladium varicosporioides]|nr:glycoside hydrolase superfamily [Hymenoscyphus varicosporioides]